MMMTTEEEALKQKLCTNCGYKHDETTPTVDVVLWCL